MDFKHSLLNSLLRLDCANFDKYRNEVTLRCPFCGDSIKRSTATHFGVKLELDTKHPIWFHCFRCGIGGVLTPQVLRDFGISDLKLNSSLLSYNNKTMGSVSNTFRNKNNDIKLIVPKPRINNITANKYKYFNNRFDVNESLEFLHSKKVIFSLGDFLKVNKIEKLTCGVEKALAIDKNFIGFLSARNEFVTNRNITNIGKRYEVYNIFDKMDNTRQFYIMPNKINLFSTKIQTIHIAEGVMDVFGLYYLYDRCEENQLYVAVCGAGFASVLKYLIRAGLVGNVNINIYSDNDRSPYYYNKIVEELTPWVHKITIYYNAKGKDYGVPRDRILLKRKVLY